VSVTEWADAIRMTPDAAVVLMGDTLKGQLGQMTVVR
jgi:hypothetical protein